MLKNQGGRASKDDIRTKAGELSEPIDRPKTRRVRYWTKRRRDPKTASVDMSPKATQIMLDTLKRRDGPARKLREFRAGNEGLRANYRLWLHEALVQVYSVANYLRADRDAWVEFCSDPEWEGVKGRPSIKRSDDALRHALKFAYGAFGDRNKTKRASIYSIRLKPLFARRATADEVRAELAVSEKPEPETDAPWMSHPPSQKFSRDHRLPKFESNTKTKSLHEFPSDREIKLIVTLSRRGGDVYVRITSIGGLVRYIPL